MKIGVFDSGIGGLTVLKRLIEEKPNNTYLYIGDTLNMPYGAKTKEELLSCCRKIVNYFVNERVDAVIIACGTVSSTIYKELKEEYKDLKIFDIITPTLDYITNNNIDNICAIATINTIKSNVFVSSLQDKNVYQIPCPLLASLIEKDDKTMYEHLDECLEKVKDKKIDLLVLGCTHYPVVEEYIKEKYGYTTLNMADPLLGFIDEGNEKNVKIMFTKLDDTVNKNVIRILKKDVDIEKIEL